MKHDTKLIETANSELLTLGEGVVAYLRLVDPKEVMRIGAESVEMPESGEIWGLYSASGETLALCDSPEAAWHFAAESKLVPVQIH